MTRIPLLLLAVATIAGSSPWPALAWQDAPASPAEGAGDAGPRESLCHMDMDHPDHVEIDAPPGYTRKARAGQP